MDGYENQITFTAEAELYRVRYPAAVLHPSPQGEGEKESMKKAYYSYIYKLSRMERRELKRDLYDLRAGYPVYTKTDKVKNVLYELGYMVEQARNAVYPITC